MNRTIMLFIVSFVLLLSASTAQAHPPSNINITYDKASKVLTAIITHNTNNPAAHFINKIDVGLNGREILMQEIARQDNNADQTVSYRIPDTKAGDVLSVEGYCNISGKLTKKLTVQAD